MLQKVEDFKVTEVHQAATSSSVIAAASPAPASNPPLVNGSRAGAMADAPLHATSAHPKRGSVLGSILASAVISLVFGGVGAWVFLTYLMPTVAPEGSSAPADSNAGAAPAAAATAPAGPSSDDLKQLTKEIDDVSTRLDRLQERFSAVPRPEAPTDLSKLQQEIDALEKDNESYTSLPGRVSALSDRIAALEQAVAATRNEPNSTGGQAKKSSGPPRPPLTMATRRDVTAPGQPPADNENDIRPDLAQAAQLFRTGKYTEARDLCAMLEEAHSQDARVWYYGALANGLATGRWDKETERLASKGVERERAGTPGKSEIDDALSRLTPTSGREWLLAVRRGARR